MPIIQYPKISRGGGKDQQGGAFEPPPKCSPDVTIYMYIQVRRYTNRMLVHVNEI